MRIKFSLKDYLKKNLINGYKDETWSESEISELAVRFMEKGYITVEDIEEIDTAIQEYKESLKAVDVSDDEEITGP